MPRPILRDAIYRRRRFKPEVIEQCVRWYVTYRLSYRDICALMADQGVSVTHSAVMRWVFRFVPEYEQRWARFALPVGSSWRMDETAVRILGRHQYVYRAVDKDGKTVHSMLAPVRSVHAAALFFRRAVASNANGFPAKINLDKYFASHLALRSLGDEDERWRSVQVRDRRYLNNVVEQDHRAIKSRCAPMLGFKSSQTAAVSIAGIELAHRIRKGQFHLPRPPEEQASAIPSLREQWKQALKLDGETHHAKPAPKPLLHQISLNAAGCGSFELPKGPRRYPRKVFVGNGLYVLQHPRGGRYWRYKYRFEGKERHLALGVYPVVTAEFARARHLAARRLLDQGVDPARERRESKASAKAAVLSC